MTKKAKRRLARPRTGEQYLALTEQEQEIWNQMAHVISKMLSRGQSLTKTSREFGLDPKVVKALAGPALRKKKNGRYVARANDKLLRILVIPGRQGLREIAVKGSGVASKIGEYSAAVQHYLRTGDSSPLKRFKRMKLVDEKGKRIKLITDLTELKRLGSAGVLSFESIYRRAS